MADKRCYNKSDALQYFGIDRDAFEKYIEPELAGKGIEIGNCLVYEAYDLDKAWEAFKKKNKRPDTVAADSAQPASPLLPKTVRGRAKGAMPSAHLGSEAWNEAVKKVLEKGKPRKK